MLKNRRSSRAWGKEDKGPMRKKNDKKQVEGSNKEKGSKERARTTTTSPSRFSAKRETFSKDRFARDRTVKDERFRKDVTEEFETTDEYCWGRKPVLEMLEMTPERCLRVSLSKNFHGAVAEKIMDLCKQAHIPVQRVDPMGLERLCNGENHQGVLAMTSQTPLLDIEDVFELLPPQSEPALGIILDHVKDPHNLGAIIRSAEAAGACFVAIPKRRSALPMGTVVKTSAGASLRIPLVSIGNISQAIERLQEGGFWSVGLDAEGKESLFAGNLPKRLLLIVGAEGEGIGHTTGKTCDELRHIPMIGSGTSLNASVAAGIALFEWVKTFKISE